MLRLAALLSASSFAAGACGSPGFLEDPIRASEVAALGPEDDNVPAGPLHRPGQPCAACHRPDGAATTAYLAAGTIYRDPVATIPVADIDVAFVDSAGRKFTTKTNCVGNFYIKPTEFPGATFPIWVALQYGEFPWKMESPIHREASCAACHFDPLGPATAGHVFLTDDESLFPGIPVRACNPTDGIGR